MPKTAVDFAGKLVINSDLVLAIAATEPNSPRCAVPTTKTTPTLGFATLVSRAISPMWRAPISKTQYLVVSLDRSKVNGTPISVLKFPSVAIVWPFRVKIEFKNSLVVVFPWEPVIPTTLSSDNLTRR